MIKLKKLKFRNVLSYGNVWTEYNFKQGVTRISGKNGMGKSTIIDALYYGMFGKPFRKVPMRNLYNTTNKKNLGVILEFSDGINDYKIIRNAWPDEFSIYRADQLIDQASTKKGYQAFLEEEVFHFTENIFQQIGIKSLTRYGSFLKMSKSNKRSVIENIFDLEVISVMKDCNKSNLDAVDTELTLLSKDEGSTKTLISTELANIQQLRKIKEQLEQNVEEENRIKEDKIVEIEKEIIRLNDGLRRIEIKEKEKEKLQKEKDEIESSVTSLNRKLKKIEREVEFSNKKSQFLEEICPACPKRPEIVLGFMENDKSDIITKYKGEINEYNIKFQELTGTISECNKMLAHKPTIKVKIQTSKKNITDIKSSIKKKQNTTVEIDETKYNEHKERLVEISEEIVKKKNILRYYQVAQTMLKDDGIKSYIIKKYLPLLNKLINTFLQKFGLNLEIQFTTELDINIETKFKEKFVYDNFSEGEKKKIDLAILFTFIEFVKLKHSNAKIDVMILDEFSAGLDADSENILYEILKDMSENDESEIITVSHSSMIDPDKINRRFVVTNQKGFSQMELITE